MDKKIEIKEEDPLSNDIASQKEREFFHVSVKTSIDNVLVDTDCNMTVQTEVKSETSFIKHPVEQVKTESATCSNNWEMLRETEIEQKTLFSQFDSQNEGEFLLEDPLMGDNKYNSDHQIHNKIEIKEEPWTLETETSSVCDNIKDGDIPPEKSSRLYPETFSAVINDKLPLPLAGVPAGDISFSNGIDRLAYEYKKCDVACNVIPAKKVVHSNQYAKGGDKVDTFIQPLCWKHRSLNYTRKMPQQCRICEKSFSCMLNLKAQVLVHEGKVTYQCKTCSKSFTHLDNLKTHNLVHDGKKTHPCKMCNKSFTRLSSLKRHTLVHEGNKVYQCKVCDRSFTQLSTLKTHNLIHDGKKSNQCKICNKSFTQLSDLKIHNLIHEGKKPHHCTVCDKSFTQLGTLKTHNLIHESKKTNPILRL